MGGGSPPGGLAPRGHLVKKLCCTLYLMLVECFVKIVDVDESFCHSLSDVGGTFLSPAHICKNVSTGSVQRNSDHVSVQLYPMIWICAVLSLQSRIRVELFEADLVGNRG